MKLMLKIVNIYFYHKNKLKYFDRLRLLISNLLKIESSLDKIQMEHQF
jgi:hypothetical protein